MFHTKKQINDIRSLHIGAGFLVYRTSDKEVIEKRIVIITGKILNAGTGKPIEFNTIEDDMNEVEMQCNQCKKTQSIGEDELKAFLKSSKPHSLIKCECGGGMEY